MALQNPAIHIITKNCGNMLSPKIATSRIITTLVVGVVKGTKSKAIIYMNPNIRNEFISSIKEMFEIKEEPIIKLDYSKHYKCFLD